MPTIQDVNVTISTVDREAMVALAEAVKANAEALTAIANMGKVSGPIYGIYLNGGEQ